MSAATLNAATGPAVENLDTPNTNGAPNTTNVAPAGSDSTATAPAETESTRKKGVDILKGRTLVHDTKESCDAEYNAVVDACKAATPPMKCVYGKYKITLNDETKFVIERTAGAAVGRFALPKVKVERVDSKKKTKKPVKPDKVLSQFSTLSDEDKRKLFEIMGAQFAPKVDEKKDTSKGGKKK